MSDNIDAIVESLIIDDLRNIGAASSIAQAVMYQDQSASRNRLNILAESITAKASQKMHEKDISDAVAQSAVNRGGSDAGLASLMATIAAGAIGTKTVAVTPAETGVSRSLGDIAALTALIASINK